MRKPLFAMILAGSILAMTQDSSAKPAPKKTLPSAPPVQISEDDAYAVRGPASGRGVPIGDADLVEALAWAKNGRFVEASNRLFQLSYSPRFITRRMQIKYVLGLTLQKMNLPQLAAFQYMTVVKDGSTSYASQALDKLSQVADLLGDDSLLNYAYSKIKIDSFPRSQRDRLYLRIGEFQKRHAEFKQAAGTFAHVAPGSASYPTAKYEEGLAYAEAGDVDRSVAAFDELIESRRGAGPTDSSRAAGFMGKARALYQKKDWDGAIAAYREVPRDTWPWHDTLFESSWAMLRSGRFRSALSNFHSLHSAFYENTYLPESLILRSITYLYICKYEETEKVLNLFNRMYRPAFHSVDALLRDNSKRPTDFFNALNRILNDYKNDPEKTVHSTHGIPYVVAQKISREADFQGSYMYTKNLLSERYRMQALPASWRASTLGQYSRKVLETRIAKTRQHAGKQIRTHLLAVHTELLDLIEQEGFIRYEIINGRKEELKKKIAGKELPPAQIDEGNERNYYVQNGFEYWPFRGEYWLDELGTYHYVGTQSCH